MKTYVIIAVAFTFLIINSLFGQDPPCNFVDGGSFPTGLAPSSVAAGDLDGDGDMDLAVADSGAATVSLYFNNGNATFEMKTIAPVVSPAVELKLVKIVDMNGDASQDLVVVYHGPHTVATLINDGSAVFGDPMISAFDNHWPEPNSVDVGDLDGDGDYDLHVAGFSGPDPWEGFALTLLNDGTGHVIQLGNEYNASFYVAGSKLGDLDNDHDLDAVLVGPLFSGIDVIENDGNGHFELETYFETSENNSTVAVADFNGDSQLDFAVGYLNDGDTDFDLYFNDGMTFGLPIQFSISGNPSCMEAMDIDGDSDCDLVFANGSDNTVSVLLNNSIGEFSQPVVVPVGLNPRSLALADLDGDFDLDIVSANFESNDISILLNEPILRGDVNLDGSVDLLDVAPFVHLLVDESYQVQADLNCDGELNLLDVSPFVDALIGA